MKNILIKQFLFVFFLISYLQSFGTGAFQVNDKSFTLNQYWSFDIRSAFLYDLDLYENYEIRVKYKTAGISYGNAIPNTENNIVFSNPIDQSNDGTYNYVTYHIDDKKLSNDGDRHSISIVFTGFVNILQNTSCTADLSQEVTFEIFAEEKTCNSGCVKTSLGMDFSTVTTPKAVTGTPVLTASTIRLQPENNYYTPVVSDINANFSSSAYPIVNFKIEYPSSSLDYLLISEYEDREGYNYNFNYESSPSPFVSQSSSAGVINITVNRSVRFRVYFAPKVTQQSYAPGIKVTMTADGNQCVPPLNQIVQDASTVNMNYDPLQTLRPVIEGPKVNQYIPCLSNCNFDNNFTTLYFEANNIYSASSALNNVRVTIPAEAILSSLTFNSDQYTSSTYPQLSYSVAGQTFDLTPSGNIFTFPANTAIEYIELKNLNLASKAKDFQLTYSNKNTTSTAPIIFTFFYPEYKQGGVDQLGLHVYQEPINPVNYSCTNNSYISDQYRPGAYAPYSSNLFSPNGTGFVLITLRPSDYNYPTDYSYDLDYTLNEYMKFNSTVLKFAKDDSYDNWPASMSAFQSSINSLLSSNDWTLAANGYIKIIDNKIIIRGLKLKNTCSSNPKRSIHILASIIVDKEVPSLNHSSVVEDKSVTHNLATGLSNWTVPAYFNLSTKIYLSCNDENFLGGNVKNGDVISLRYVIKNASTGSLSNFDISGKTLKFGSTALNPTNVSAFVLDKNDNRTPVSLPFSANNIISGDNIVMQINGVPLDGFKQLVIDINFSITQSLVLNSQSNNYFTAKETNTIAVLSDPIDIIVSTNSVCGEIIPPPLCSECITSFSPVPGQRYLLSAWVKESITGILPTAYVNSGIKITFNNGAIQDLPVFKGAGPVIDGWQRIEQSFVVPINAKNIQIQLVSEDKNVEVYFDDIRIHPFKSNMKSFVYDPSSQRLIAELDENNYATLYEYDDEGILIRVKKETERGVMTIKESRNNQSKIFKNEP